jgi:hypothetical protein
MLPRITLISNATTAIASSSGSGTLYFTNYSNMYSHVPVQRARVHHTTGSLLHYCARAAHDTRRRSPHGLLVSRQSAGLTPSPPNWPIDRPAVPR